ncbi:MAG: succinoglycan biosynthesis protein ExoA [Thermoleophilaceae bacterium]|jgi:glycosyltransferase involved in cell wall biosynthesis|nr:succinoglycan biosynthesis protein ExoA [Thermoleophilaceae bacterium]
MGGARIGTISVVAPVRNEGSNVDVFVSDLAAQDFGGELEVLVADGNSDDGSADRLLAAGRAAGLDLRVLENPAGWVSHGLNACIREARGDLIVRLDCHSRYSPDYLRRCAELSEQTGAWNVGGRLVPTGITPTERAVACAMDSPFGGIGWTRASTDGPVETDTVTFGAFRPEAFEHAGLYDETLVRNQDDEFNLRLRRAGGRIVLDPAITVMYRPRGSIARVWRQYYEYGLWKVPVMLKHRRVLTMRSVAPLAFVLATLVLLAATARFPLARRLLVFQWTLYGSAGVAFAARSVRQHDESWVLVPRVLAAFPAFHLGHGSGQIVGWLRALARGRR